MQSFLLPREALEVAGLRVRGHHICKDTEQCIGVRGGGGCSNFYSLFSLEI